MRKLDSPEEILNAVFEKHGLVKFSDPDGLKSDITPQGLDAISEAMKEYVKQWLDEAIMFDGNAIEIGEYLNQLKGKVENDTPIERPKLDFTRFLKRSPFHHDPAITPQEPYNPEPDKIDGC